MLREQTDKQGLNQSFDEKLFRLLVASISDYAIFMVDPNGYVMSWNPGAQHIKGFTEEEIIGRHVAVFYTSTDNKKNQPRHDLNEALKKGMYEKECWLVRNDDSVFWAHLAYTTVYNDNGHLMGFALVARDITERKIREERNEEINAELERRVEENTERILANELRFRKLIENSYDGISLFDKNFNIIYRSQSSERISGWTNEERAARVTEDLVHPEDRSRVIDLHNEILSKPGVPIIANYRTRHKQGHYICIDCLYTNWLNDTAINAIVCNFRDISERMEAEEELKNKNQQIENILESITDGFIALDKDLNYTYANKRVGEMFDREPGSLIGRYIWSEFPDAVNSDTYKAFNKALSKKEYVINEDHYAPLDLWHENHVYPSPGGGLSVFIRDISARKKAELAVLEMNTTLEKKVEERTLQLAEANEELESFSYSVSHDLRAPLRAVNGYAMMLKEDFEDRLDDEGNRLIDIIINNARLMGQLIDDLLTFSRMGRKPLNLLMVDMNALVKICLNELLANEQNKYQLKVSKLPTCYADINLLRQVLLNIIGNAVKYSSKGNCPVIEIGTVKDDTQVVYYVKDNGVGFDMQYSDKLFGVFQRLHSNAEFEGTGVGLALAKRIINKHGGNIWAESELGKGAAFYFSMPF